MKFLSRYLAAIAETSRDEQALCAKVINLFVEFVKNDGDVLRSPARFVDMLHQNCSENEKALLRANAGSNLLKIFYHRRYSNLLQPAHLIVLGKLMHVSGNSLLYYI